MHTIARLVGGRGNSRLRHLNLNQIKMDDKKLNTKMLIRNLRRRQETLIKLKDSFESMADEYRISERWREHFRELFSEI